MGKKLTVIGDVHGHIETYKQIAEDSEYSIQLGDMGFNYTGLNSLDPDKHKFFGGNHEDYDLYYQVPHSLGDFGMDEINGLEFFYVRGAFSIDIMYRLDQNMNGNKSWWDKEQLTYKQMSICEEEYAHQKPDIVITHTAPTKAIRDNFSTSTLNRLGFSDTFQDHTSGLLQRMFEIHQPSIWIFGHFHKGVVDTINGTEFHCLPELGFIDI